MTVDKHAAIELAERWLEAVQADSEGPRARVDRDGAHRGIEGWVVPWDNVAFLDGGDEMQRIYPPQRLIVTEPEGELRTANTTPHPGFSVPAQWPGKPRYTEIIDPEYRRAGLYRAGVPRKVVAGWKVEHPDGSQEEKANPTYLPGPERAGMPRAENRLEMLLNYREIGVLPQATAVRVLFDESVLIPVTSSGGLHSDAGNEDGSVRVYSSPRKTPTAIRWQRMTVPSFVARFPGKAMLINAGAYPRLEVTAAELAEVAQEYSRFPAYQPQQPEEITEPGLDGSLDDYSEHLKQRFSLDHAPRLSARDVRAARSGGYELTEQERERRLLGIAWMQANRQGTQQGWPAELRSNGLVLRHQPDGSARPVLHTFGKVPVEGILDLHRSWHAAVGAYVGFALGDALGSAVDAMSWEEIRGHYGEHGITTPGQVSWRTQLLLFRTEGMLRGMGRYSREPSRAGVRAAQARWLTAQGMPWQQAAGPLVAEIPEPDGWLTRVPELVFERGTPPGLLAAVQRQIADPAADSGVRGPIELMWALPAALARCGPGELLAGFHRDPADVAGARLLHAIFAGLFVRADFVEPVWMQLVQLFDHLAGTGDAADQQVREAAKRAASRWRKYFESDRAELESIGEGTDTPSVLGRTLLAAAKREYDPRLALLTAVNHSGRSALTGALTGALVGARAGVPGLPQDWLAALDLADLVQEVADDAFWTYAHRNAHHEVGEDWDERYPPQ